MIIEELKILYNFNQNIKFFLNFTNYCNVIDVYYKLQYLIVNHYFLNAIICENVTNQFFYNDNKEKTIQ